MGKPYTLREDYIIRNACEASWHLQRFSLPTDRALAAYAVLQQIMSRAIDSIYSSTQTISGLRNDCDCVYSPGLLMYIQLMDRHVDREICTRGATSVACRGEYIVTTEQCRR